MRLSVGSVGPFLLPVALAAGALWLGWGSGDTGPAVFVQDLRAEPGVLRIGITSNPPNLDPVEMSDTTSDSVVERICNTLVSFDEHLRLVPSLAESIPEVSPDGLVYTFRLRRGVKFQNGRTMEAGDVRYSLQRLAEPISKRFWIVEPVRGATAARDAMARNSRGDPQAPIAGIETPDPLTVRITLEKVQPLFPMFLAMNNASIVAREEVQALGQRFGRQVSGTGPFRLVEWKDNDRLVLERFDGYFEGPAKLRSVVYRVITEEETRFQSYLNGELDVIEAPYGNVRRIRGSNIGDQLRVNPMLDIRYHGFNMERVLRGPGGEVVPLGGNPESSPGEPVRLTGDQRRRARLLRQAINYAIDREFLCTALLEGRAVPAKGVLPPGMEAYDPGLAGYRYDPARAKALLAEAGYPEGRGLPEIPYNFNFQPPNPTVAQAIQSMLLRVGVRTRLRQMDWGAYQTYLDEGKATFFRLAWIADYPDPENFLYVLFHSKNKGQEGNNARFVDPENDRLLEEARSTVDPVERKARWRRAEAYIVEQAPWAFLYHNATALLIKPYVKGMVLTAMDSGAEIQQVDLTKVTVEAGAR